MMLAIDADAPPSPLPPSIRSPCHRLRHRVSPPRYPTSAGRACCLVPFRGANVATFFFCCRPFRIGHALRNMRCYRLTSGRTTRNRTNFPSLSVRFPLFGPVSSAPLSIGRGSGNVLRCLQYVFDMRLPFPHEFSCAVPFSVVPESNFRRTCSGADMSLSNFPHVFGLIFRFGI